MRNIPEQQIKILEALAVYRFLTADQIIRLGITQKRPNVSTAFKNLEQGAKKLTDRKTFGVNPERGKIPNVHYLTKHGVKFLVEELGHEEENIKFPKGNSSLFNRDYDHRVATVDSHINFRQSAISSAFEVDFFDTYFDKTGANRGTSKKKLEAQTKIELESTRYFIPDGAGRFDDGIKKHLFLFELYNGKDTKRVIEQLGKHQEALELGTATERYKHDRAHRVLCVFEHRGELEAVARRMQQHHDFTDTKAHYLFKTLEQVRNGESFFTNWLDYDLKTHSLTGVTTEKQPAVRVKVWKTPQKEQPKAQEAPKEESKPAQPSKKKRKIKWW